MLHRTLVPEPLLVFVKIVVVTDGFADPDAVPLTIATVCAILISF
jgi:hypothetical protein